jgi:putative endonuclease
VPAPPGTTTRTGASAEDEALAYLCARGLVPVARNFRCRAGELDHVMLDGDVLVIVEVRYRLRADPVDPAVTVTGRKQRRLAHATLRFLQAQPRFRDHALRFDVLALSGPLDAPRCDWIRRAFTMDDLPRR